jgi:hypothetical protein
MNYRVMRMFGRFKFYRDLYLAFRAAGRPKPVSKNPFDPFTKKSNVNEKLHKQGIGLGLNLKEEYVDKIRDYARANLCFADRDSSKGFYLSELSQVNKVLGKDVLVAQYFNVSQIRIIKDILDSNILNSILNNYFKTEYKLVGTNLWWTFPGNHTQLEREKHAHMFHRDIDDFKFVKLFIYINDVGMDNGPHTVVQGSHKNKLITKFSDIWKERRYLDSEVERAYGESIKTITGPAGTAFFENTLCLHKGVTPKTKERLLLQFEWAINDYAETSDIREVTQKII